MRYSMVDSIINKINKKESQTTQINLHTGYAKLTVA